MAEALPPPLTPPGCDLRDFAFMPLEIQRLRRSKAWLKAKRNPALAFYQINLWTAAWHDVPAGSIEDDDDVLADLAMCDPAKWDKVRADVLRGWVKCSDGRLCNPTVCEKALESWDAKLDQRWRTECARIKKHNERHHTEIARPTFDAWMSAGCPQGQRLPVPGDKTATPGGQAGEMNSKGEGEGKREGQGQGNTDSVPDGTGGDPPPTHPMVAAGAQLQASARDLTEDEERLLWNAGLAMLLPSYTTGSDKQKDARARTFVGGLAKRIKDAGLERRQLFDVIQAACVERPLNPETWLSRSVADRCGKRQRAGQLTDEQRRDADAASDAGAMALILGAAGKPAANDGVIDAA